MKPVEATPEATETATPERTKTPGPEELQRTLAALARGHAFLLTVTLANLCLTFFGIGNANIAFNNICWNRASSQVSSK